MSQPGSATITDQVLETLITRIVEGDMPAGSKFSEQDLADTLHVSRAPLREAIRRLEGLNLVKHIPHVGARVVELTHNELIEIYEIREALEGMAAGLAAKNMNEGEINYLGKLLDVHEQGIEQSGGNEYFQKQGDFDFHYCIIHGSKNKRLIKQLCGELYHLIRMYRHRSSSSLSRRPGKALAEHRNIVAAIEERDSEFAEMLMRRHIKSARSNIEHQFLSGEKSNHVS